MLYQESQEYLEALTNLSIEREIETSKMLCLNALYRLGQMQSSYNSFYDFYEKNNFLSAKQFKYVKHLMHGHGVSFDSNWFNVDSDYKPKKKKKLKGKKKNRKH